MIHLTEDILQFCWKHSLFEIDDLKTVNGDEIIIRNKGVLNLNSGPDFSNAKIQIGKTLWAGNVEIHTKSSDWNLHQHQTDPAYKNVILHVVYHHDEEIKIANRNIPVLTLKNRIKPSLFRKYKELATTSENIPCFKQIKAVKNMAIIQQIDRAVADRFEAKSEFIESLLVKNNYDWEETAFQLFTLNHIGKINAQPTEWLLNEINFKLLKSFDSTFQIEALLIGLGGWLENCTDSYSFSLKKEYEFIKNKFQLNNLSASVWKTGRMRPAAFPTFRMAQLASLIKNTEHFFSMILQTVEQNNIKHTLQFPASPYWENHCHIHTSIQKRNTTIGKGHQNSLFINVFAPLVYTYGKFLKEEKWKEKAFLFLEKLPPEKNNIIKKWESYDIKAKSALETQGLIQMHNEFCIRKKCLSCIIGMHILSQ